MNIVKVLNKSIHNIYQSFSQKETRPKINFLKICYLKIDDNKNLLSIILQCDFYIKIFLLQNEPIIEFKLIFNEHFSIDIFDIKPINYFPNEKNFEKPIIAIFSNSNIYFNNNLRFYSINNKQVIKNIQFKYNVSHSDFGKKYFGIGCINGKIYIFDNKTCNKIFKISLEKILHIDENNLNKNLSSNTATISMMIDNKIDIINSLDDVNKINNINPTQSVLIGNNFLQNNKEKKENKYQNIFYETIFDISDNILCYFISKEEKENLNNEQNENNFSTFENLAIEAYKKISKLKDWSLKNYQNIINLRKSTNVKSNLDILDSKTSTLNVSLFDISKAKEKQIQNFHCEKLPIPFFRKKISFIKQIKNGKFIIIGNKHSQFFYIFEFYSQTNSKYNSDSLIDKNIKYKLIYSVFRGFRNCNLLSFEMSFNNDFCCITSNTGTTHLFNFPLRDNQIVENIENTEIDDNKNKQSEEYLNMKIINAIDIFKVKKDHYNDLNNSCFYSKIVFIDKVHLDNNNFNGNEINTINEISKDKFMSFIKNGNYLIVLNDNIVYMYLIYNMNTIIPLKSIHLNLNLDKDSILQNYANISKNLYLNTIHNYNIKNKKNNINLDINTTNLSNFSIFQINPMFSFNIYSNIGLSFNKNDLFIEEKNTQITYINKENEDKLLIKKFTNEKKENTSSNSNKVNIKNEIELYESLCNEQEYIPINKLNDPNGNSYIKERITSNKIIINPKYGDPMSSIEIKNDFYNIKDNILENNIKNALESNINDLINTKNSVNLKNKLVIQEDFYN